MYSNKNVLVAGGTGTIGIPLVRMLREQDANVTVASLDNEEYAARVLPDGTKFIRSNLELFDNCLNVTMGQDYVFNLVGIKGSVGLGESKVASYLVPMLRFQTNLMEASFINNVTGFMFTSSVCIYPQADEHFEDNAWNGMPRQNDRIPGLAKRIGEIQGEAYLKEHGWQGVKILRPSNVFGPFDDFNPISAQVIPAIISRVLSGENPLVVWGDGTTIRDFIFSEEVAFWMLNAMIAAPACVPINLGCGDAISILEIVNTIVDICPQSPEIRWDSSKPSGDPVRLMNMDRAKELLDFKRMYSLEESLEKTIKWVIDNPDLVKSGK